MMLNRESATPLHAQLEQIMRQKMASNEWPVGKLIPSENKISQEYGISRMTVRNVIAKLEPVSYTHLDVYKRQSEDYITATYAKGISRRVVNWKYAFKNALIPIITLVGMSIGSYLAGAVVVETVFAWPGIGQLTNQAVGNRDYQLVQSLLLVSATLFTLINLVVDIINSLVDPRVSLE